MLKARLQDAHPVLLYENVDTRKKTVSLSQAVNRTVGAARISLKSRELRTITKASQWRDEIVHHEFEMPLKQVQIVFAQVFEFLTRFHNDHTTFGELHTKIDPSLWAREAELVEFFQREVVLYNGVEVHRSWPSEVMAAQEDTTITLHGTLFARLRRGIDWPSITEYPCHDCGIVHGQLHVEGCDMETCPRCFGQLLTCGCRWDEGPADTELPSKEAALHRTESSEPLLGARS